MAEVYCQAVDRYSPTTSQAHDAIQKDLFPLRNSNPFTPELNPPFIFPLPSSEDISPSTVPESFLDSASISESFNLSQNNPVSPQLIRNRPQHISLDPLPSFSFPAPSTPPPISSAHSSPTRSMASRKMAGGHKRGGSEFIGGGGESSSPGLGLMNSSPTKQEAAVSKPAMSGRKALHRHRRSAAISNAEELANIFKTDPLSTRRTGSAPVTPSDPDGFRSFAPPVPALPQLMLAPLDTVAAAGEITDLDENPPADESITPTAPVASQRRCVSFSETLEYISRPSSMISSESSSTISTIRPMDINLYGDDDEDEDDEPPPTLRSSSPTDRGRLGSSKEDLAIGHADTIEGNRSSDLSATPTLQSSADRPSSSPAFPVGNKSKRGTSWSDFSSRKSKPDPIWTGRKHFGTFGFGEQQGLEEFEDVNFDDDNTFVMRDPSYQPPKSAPANPPSSFIDQGVSDFAPGAVLDLDKVWDEAGAEAEAKAKSFRPTPERRVLHSSGETSGFAGRGMHHHRRAESAPVMAPVDYSFGFPRYGSNPQMADVFEEDEDEELSASNDRSPEGHSKTSSSDEAQGLGVNVVEGEELNLPHDSRFRALAQADTVNLGKTVSKETELAMVETEKVECSGEVSINSVEGGSKVEPVNTQEPQVSLSTSSSGHSTIVPTIPPSLHSPSIRFDQFASSPELSSGNPSPVKASFDAPRLGTAHSSNTDRSAWSSSRTGGSGHGTVASAEDVPSLISSASTMISHAVPHTPLIGSRPTDDRSYSMSVPVRRPRTAGGNSSKRSSLASLHKLFPGSFGERSKLSIESRADQGEDSQDGNIETGEKAKKANRLSRLVKWFGGKSKEDMKGSLKE